MAFEREYMPLAVTDTSLGTVAVDRTWDYSVEHEPLEASS
jgi:hypothetical protein